MEGSFIWPSSRLYSGAVNFYMQYFLFTNDTDIGNYTDDNTPYVTSSKTKLAIEKLEQCFDSLWQFRDDGIKANADKYHFLVSTKVCRIKNVATTISLKQRPMKLDPK